MIATTKKKKKCPKKLSFLSLDLGNIWHWCQVTTCMAIQVGFQKKEQHSSLSSGVPGNVIGQHKQNAFWNSVLLLPLRFHIILCKIERRKM